MPRQTESDLEYRTEQGGVYGHTGKHNILAAGTFDHLIVTGPKPLHMKVLDITAAGGPFDVDVYEAPTVTNNGTAAPFVNLNRADADKLPAADLYETPTVTATGTEIWYILMPGTQQMGVNAESGIKELILAPNTTYLLRLTNNSAQAEDCTLDIVCFEE